jgi:Phosphotransferase enzyme family
VLDDLGNGASVADALLGEDPGAAETALAGWARAVAELHAATRESRELFRSALAQREGDLPVRESRVSVDLEDAVRVLDRACTGLELRPPAGAFDELRGLAKRLGGSGLAALTPADACPDNNVLTPDGLVLVDFEGAQWRHVAWDVAYLQVPWPSCWCSWRLPDAVAERAVSAYLRAAQADLPETAQAGFGLDVEAAVVGWALVSTSWFIDNALGSDPPLNPDRPTPTRRAMILHRLDRAARTGELTRVGEFAAALAGELRNRWGDVPLALAPAFRDAQ